jgi:hypothetical protein
VQTFGGRVYTDQWVGVAKVANPLSWASHPFRSSPFETHLSRQLPEVATEPTSVTKIALFVAQTDYINAVVVASLDDDEAAVPGLAQKVLRKSYRALRSTVEEQIAILWLDVT